MSTQPVDADSIDPVRRFGEGEFPRELDRLNWSAFFLGGIWALVHGTWGWFWLFVLLRLALIALAGGLHVVGMDAVAAITWAVSSAILGWAVTAIFGLRANAAAWASESKRIASGRYQPTSLTWTVETFQRRQRYWLYVGLLLTVLGYLLNWTDAKTTALKATTPYAVVVALATVALLYAFDRARHANKRSERTPQG